MKRSKVEYSAFLTQKEESGGEFKYLDEDVVLLNQWMAHKDAINFLSWVPDLKVAASCSFDCNVYVWGDSEDGT